MDSGRGWALTFDEARGALSIVGPGKAREVRVLEEFASYDDALDAMGDVRALCVGGVSVADVVALTYDAMNA